MPVKVTVHESARDALFVWMRSLSERIDDAVNLGSAYLQAIQNELAETKGRPTNAKLVIGYDPELWIWPFHDRSWWIVYAVRRKPNWFARILRRDRNIEVVILSFQREEPSQSGLALLTRALSHPKSRSDA